jgi:hypothetical protein
MPKAIDPNIIDAVIEEYLSGDKTIAEICRDRKLCKHTIGKYFKKRGIKLKSRKANNLINLIDKEFGQLKVIRRIGSHNRKTIWECMCKCGNLCQKSSYEAKLGFSCGCVNRTAKDGSGFIFNQSVPGWGHKFN